MSSISSNTTLKVNSSISFSRTAAGSSGVIYTAPANGYAILNATVGVVGSQVLIGSIPSHSYPASGGAKPYDTIQIYVGPGQTVSLVNSGTGYAAITGVDFINTP